MNLSNDDSSELVSLQTCVHTSLASLTLQTPFVEGLFVLPEYLCNAVVVVVFCLTLNMGGTTLKIGVIGFGAGDTGASMAKTCHTAEDRLDDWDVVVLIIVSELFRSEGRLACEIRE